jgi:NAD(P)H-nitrite reductase large subunit
MKQVDRDLFAGPDRQRLVVIGNGMVGARFVEELLARGGGDRFEVVMFGDEPTGNYNRILLSGILAGTHELEDTYINPLEWYERNGVTLHAGVRVTDIDRDRGSCAATPVCSRPTTSSCSRRGAAPSCRR